MLVRAAKRTSDAGADRADGPSAVALLRRLFWVPTAAINLAVLRVVVFGALATVALTAHAADFSRLPDSLIVAPPQLGDLLVALPRQPALVTAATWILVAACLAAAADGEPEWPQSWPRCFPCTSSVSHSSTERSTTTTTWCGWPCSSPALRRPTHSRSTRDARARHPHRCATGSRCAWPGCSSGAATSSPGSRSSVNGASGCRATTSAVSSTCSSGPREEDSWSPVGCSSPRPRPRWRSRSASSSPCSVDVSEHGRSSRGWAFIWRLSRRWASCSGPCGSVYVGFVDWSSPMGRPSENAADPPRRGTLVAGSVLVFGVVTAGLLLVTSAWPFACSPTFAGSLRGERPGLDGRRRRHRRRTRPARAHPRLAPGITTRPRSSGTPRSTPTCSPSSDGAWCRTRRRFECGESSSPPSLEDRGARRESDSPPPGGDPMSGNADTVTRAATGTLVYDGDCGFCSRFVAWAEKRLPPSVAIVPSTAHRPGRPGHHRGASRCRSVVGRSLRSTPPRPPCNRQGPRGDGPDRGSFPGRPALTLPPISSCAAASTRSSPATVRSSWQDAELRPPHVHGHGRAFRRTGAPRLRRRSSCSSKAAGRPLRQCSAISGLRHVRPAHRTVATG